MSWISGAILSTLLVSAITTEVLEFSRCHEDSTKRFLLGSTVTASCQAPSQLQTQWNAYQSLKSSADHQPESLTQVKGSYEEMSAAIQLLVPSLPTTEVAIQSHLMSSMRSMTERILVEALWSIMNVTRSNSLTHLEHVKEEFVASLDLLTAGDLWLHIPELTQRCPMHHLCSLRSEWQTFHDVVRKVLDASGLVSREVLPDSGEIQATLVKGMASLTDPSSCTVNISNDQWKQVMKKLNYIRIKVHQAAYHLFEIQLFDPEADYKEVEKLTEKVSHELSDAMLALEQCLRGSAPDLPVPPTQYIIDSLIKARKLLKSFTASVEAALRRGSASADVLANVEHLSNDIDKAVEKLSLRYLHEAEDRGATGNIVSLFFAHKQDVYLTELVREGLWLFVSGQGSDAEKFFYFVSEFEHFHHLLLEGGYDEKSNFTLPPSKDACTLTLMARVHDEFRILQNTMAQLFSAEDSQKQQLGYVQTEAATPLLSQAIVDFKSAWTSFRPTADLRTRDLLVAYHFSNPNAAGSKDNLDSAAGPEEYHTVHRKYHPQYRAILYQRNYYDIFFFDLEGNCIYSVYKELDFATNFAADGTGPFRNSNLADAYRQALETPDEIHVTSWAPYDASDGALASFMCTGVRLSGSGTVLVGVFCTQMPPEARPVTVAEMEDALHHVEDDMLLAVSYFEKPHTCTSSMTAIAWEKLLEKMSLIHFDCYRLHTEFMLLRNGISQLWLDQSVLGREGQKASIEASLTSELIDAMVEFKTAWDAYRPTNEERLLSLQIAYILLNEFPAGEKDKLDVASGPEYYHEVHQKYHPTYRALLYEKNYFDIFFLDVEGNCIYSVGKEKDYATNFAADGAGEWKDSGLGDAFRAAMNSPDTVNYIDWKPYGPSNGALASFLSIGVRRGGNLIGVFCTQLPPEFEPRNSSSYLHEAMLDLTDMFTKFRYGSLHDNVYPPPTQPIADALVNASDAWDKLRPLLAKPDQDLVEVRTLTENLVDKGATLNSVILEAAWVAQPALEGAKIQLAAEQLWLLQRLVRDTVHHATSNGGASINVDMERFEENLQAFQRGRSERRLSSKTDISMVTSIAGLRLLSSLESAWLVLKPKMTGVFDMETVPEASLKDFMDVADDTHAAAQAVMEYVSTQTRTTTLMQVHILTPVPMTGAWAAGQTFRTALRLVESVINEDQLILPGYELKHDVIDDECDGGKGADVVVSAQSALGSYVALTGLGCNDVCQQVSTLSASLKLPFLSFNCPNPDFSNVAAFPSLARLGTVLEPSLPQIVRQLKDRHSWKHVFVISGNLDAAAETERYASALREAGITTELLRPSSERRIEDIVTIMNVIKDKTQGEFRLLMVVGEETFFRRLICASIMARLHKGLTWISLGSRRDEWWKKSDLSTSAQRQWLTETAGSLQLVNAFTALKKGWDEFRSNLEATKSALTELYVTEEKDGLVTVDGQESYHKAHQEWHPVYRSLLYERNYYDIFFFDLEGSMFYSVFKESDFATSFAADSDGPWKDSGLGQVYQAVLSNPENISYADWQKYGPSGDALAAFFATGIRDSTGALIGVYAIQLPQGYEKSIEETQEECSLEAMTEAYEGAINIVGLGKPVEADMEKPLQCFKGHSPRSFLTLLDHHLATGFPEGDVSTTVSDPYHDVKAHAVDAACAIAFSLQGMLKQGYSIQQVQHPTDEVYQRFKNFLLTQMDFQGISGRVSLEGNDRANTVVVQQVHAGSLSEVALVSDQGIFQWIGNGTVEDGWMKEPVPPFEQLWLIQVGLIVLAISCPCLIGMIVGWRMVLRRKALQVEERNQV